jgi:dolichyl-phosphate-mannose--protein O-mannosyl transferase
MSAVHSGHGHCSEWPTTATHALQDEPCPQGEYIKKGRQVRLQHVGTKKWLHSHLHRSPLSGQQEVSAYGSSQQSDTGDVWTITWDSSAASWDTATKVPCLILCWRGSSIVIAAKNAPAW